MCRIAASHQSQKLHRRRAATTSARERHQHGGVPQRSRDFFADVRAAYVGQESARCRLHAHLAGVFWCVAACCSLLQFVAVCRSMLQCVAVAVTFSLTCVLHTWAKNQQDVDYTLTWQVCCSTLQRVAYVAVAVCRSVSQCVVVCCSVLQCVAVTFSLTCVLHTWAKNQQDVDYTLTWQVCCSTLQRVAVCFNVSQSVAICRSVLQCVAVTFLPTCVLPMQAKNEQDVD